MHILYSLNLSLSIPSPPSLNLPLHLFPSPPPFLTVPSVSLCLSLPLRLHCICVFRYPYVSNNTIDFLFSTELLYPYNLIKIWLRKEYKTILAHNKRSRYTNIGTQATKSMLQSAREGSKRPNKILSY